jgi:hypothetical protein
MISEVVIISLKHPPNLKTVDVKAVDLQVPRIYTLNQR